MADGAAGVQVGEFEEGAFRIDDDGSRDAQIAHAQGQPARQELGFPGCRWRHGRANGERQRLGVQRGDAQASKQQAAGIVVGIDAGRVDAYALVLDLEAINSQWARKAALRALDPDLQRVERLGDGHDPREPRCGQHEPACGGGQQQQRRDRGKRGNPGGLELWQGDHQKIGVKLRCSRGDRSDSDSDWATSKPTLRNGRR